MHDGHNKGKSKGMQLDDGMVLCSLAAALGTDS